LRRSKRLAGIPADGPPVTDGTHKVTGDTTVRTIHLDEGVGIVDASEPKAVNFIFNTSINSDPGEPKSIFEALNGADKKWWKLSGIAEVNNFLSRGAWKFVLKSSVPDRKLVGTKGRWNGSLQNQNCDFGLHADPRCRLHRKVQSSRLRYVNQDCSCFGIILL